jgi:uncharacterized membrane protein YeaQ/YmgE (transglycosylase-associated protein family)
MQKLPGDPLSSFLVQLGIGACAGWIAHKITRAKPDLTLNVLLGITGALVGAKVGEVLDISLFGMGRPVAALLGSVFILIGWRQLQSL